MVTKARVSKKICKAPKKKFHIKMQEGESLYKFNDFEKAREMLAKIVDITGGHGLYITYELENLTVKDKMKYGNDFLMTKRANS